MDPNIIAILYIAVGCVLGIVFVTVGADREQTQGEEWIMVLFCLALWPLIVILAPILWLYEDDKKNNMGKRS